MHVHQLLFFLLSQLVQAHVPQGPGRYQKVCVVVTDGAVYLTQYGKQASSRRTCIFVEGGGDMCARSFVFDLHLKISLS